MSAFLTARDLHLSVPNLVQAERGAQSWLATLLVAATSRLKRDYRPLLHGIDFSIKEGDRLGLLGRNGAGKTTLLRVLTGSLQPTQGYVEAGGTRQALLNLGLGFNNEATLKENIYLRGTAMGIAPSKIRGMIGSVLEFASLEGVANHRLATLSSGQRMRLGFAISTSVQHDIMLLDEWFGAGDAEFVSRARERMSDRVSGSKIVVLASHNSNMLRKVCNLGLVMDGGRMHYFGPVEDAISAYKSIYQATPEYQAARAEVDQQAERIVRVRKRELEKEAKAALDRERAELQKERGMLKQERAKLQRLIDSYQDISKRNSVSGSVCIHAGGTLQSSEIPLAIGTNLVDSSGCKDTDSFTSEKMRGE